MTIKIIKRGQKSNETRYRSSKVILTPQDIKEADKFDDKLNRSIDEIEKILLKKDVLSKKSHKKDPLQAWYIIGTHINKFLKNNKLATEDENLFWENLYGRSKLINKKVPSSKVSLTRNDFKTASLLARYPFGYINKVGLWALWREIIIYRVFQDKRILAWVIQKLIQSPRTRDQARPLLKAVANRFKRIDTTFLNKEELLIKLGEIKE